MHDQQVLVDRVQVILVDNLDQVNVGVQVLNTELLVRILVLLHEDPVFDLLIPHRLLEVPGEHHGTHQQNEVLERDEEE